MCPSSVIRRERLPAGERRICTDEASSPLWVALWGAARLRPRSLAFSHCASGCGPRAQEGAHAARSARGSRGSPHQDRSPSHATVTPGKQSCHESCFPADIGPRGFRCHRWKARPAPRGPDAAGTRAPIQAQGAGPAGAAPPPGSPGSAGFQGFKGERSVSERIRRLLWRAHLGE
ncbi:PREDICTED: collagen alpha-1(I) chain-like [Chinchilla lanigera]|uniref:collagen alpha-1(I) chain-like n=1 Tax=Chinchilla lanigera TaxID=34839 RepID=UPI000695D21B|nr:PREDICTED: collagen alpha-1(I) chain-like [Chinchilla lanigera]